MVRRGMATIVLMAEIRRIRQDITIGTVILAIGIAPTWAERSHDIIADVTPKQWMPQPIGAGRTCRVRLICHMAEAPHLRHAVALARQYAVSSPLARDVREIWS